MARSRSLLALALLMASAYTLTVGGTFGAASYLRATGVTVGVFSEAAVWLAFWAYALPALAILGAHEGGHWWMARRYRVRTQGPFLLPWPIAWSASLPVFAFGTLGGVVLFRDRLPSKVAEWDIAAAGIYGGLIVAVCCTVIGWAWSVPVESTRANPWQRGWFLWLQSEPRVWHPLMRAGWVGACLTAISLLPVPTFDGWRLASSALGAWPERRWSIVVMGVVCPACWL